MVARPILGLEKDGSWASPFVGVTKALSEEGPALIIMHGVFRYDGIADGIILDSSEMWAQVGLAPKAIAESVLAGGAASPSQCSPVDSTISLAPKPKPLKLYNRKSKDSRFS